jgi:hypothetical protein
MTRIALAALVSCVVIASTAGAQESTPGAAIHNEGGDIHKSCVEDKAIVGCAATFFTDHPFHVAVGTIAPQNGVGIGPAFVWHWTPANDSPTNRSTTKWQWSGSVDAVGTSSSAWRVGAFASVVRADVELPQPITPGSGRRPVRIRIHPYPVFKLYSQSISLPQLLFFGIGPNTAVSDKSFFGQRESVTGGAVVWPIAPDNNFDRLVLSLVGEVNGRWVSIRSGPSGDSPSIEHVYTEATAPGLSSQPGFVQFGEGVRIAPSLAGGHLRLNYFARYQQFQAPSDSLSSFQRWAVDLNHEIPIYGSSIPGGKDHNTANDCSISPSDLKCPPVALSRNRSGSITLRALMSRSVVSGGGVVPFYFQQTIGGSDLDGNRVLPSYEDYRFRGPNLVLFQETFEHSLFGSPIGLWLAADQGQVSQQQTGLNFTNLAHSWGIGLTLRAGGLPVGLMTYSTGPEGHHFAVTISPTLLGGSSRPALQ